MFGFHLRNSLRFVFLLTGRGPSTSPLSRKIPIPFGTAIEEDRIVRIPLPPWSPTPSSSSGILPSHIRLDSWKPQRICNRNCSMDDKIPHSRRMAPTRDLCPSANREGHHARSDIRSEVVWPLLQSSLFCYISSIESFGRTAILQVNHTTHGGETDG